MCRREKNQSLPHPSLSWEKLLMIPSGFHICVLLFPVLSQLSSLQCRVHKQPIASAWLFSTTSTSYPAGSAKCLDSILTSYLCLGLVIKCGQDCHVADHCLVPTSEVKMKACFCEQVLPKVLIINVLQCGFT